MIQTVQVRLFARFRDLLGAATVDLDLPATASVRELRETLAARHTELAALLARSQVAVNNEFAADATPVRAGDEIALIPPVSGG